MAREECFKCSSELENVFDLDSMTCIAEASCADGRLFGTLKGLAGAHRFCHGKLLNLVTVQIPPSLSTRSPSKS